MFIVDYHQKLCDHARVLILVKNFGSDDKRSQIQSTFDEFYNSISVHEFVSGKQPMLSPPFRRFLRPRNDSLGDLNLDTHSEIGLGGSPRDPHLWLRFTRDYCSYNYAWASFQSHRAVLGLIGISWCNSKEDLSAALQDYVRQKTLISDNLINGRLFILIPTNSDVITLTIEEANEVIAEEAKKLGHGLLLSPTEVLAHPAEQLFNTEIMGLNGSASDFIGSPGGEILQKNRNSGCPPPLNPRFVGALSDLTVQIYKELESSVMKMDPKITKRTSLVAAPLAPDVSDGESSESSLNVLTAPGEDLSSTQDERKFVMKPFVNFTPTEPGGNSMQPSQTDLRSLKSAMIAVVTKHKYRVASRSALKQRRSSGRWKKHLGDIFLQLGELDLAQQYYDTTIQLLRPILDNLWVAGAMEGLCAVAVCRHESKIQPATDYPPRYNRGFRQGSLYNGMGDKALSKSTDFSAGLDLAAQKVRQNVVLTPAEYCSNALEVLEMYRKALLDKTVLEETSFKIARLLVSEKQNTKACDLLDSLLLNALQDDADEVFGKVKRLSALIELYHELGYDRRASFVAWQAFDQNLVIPGENHFTTLFNSLNIKTYIPPGLAGYEESLHSSTDSGQSIDQISSFNGHWPVLYKPAVPPCLSPTTNRVRTFWCPRKHEHRSDRGNSGGTAGGGNSKRPRTLGGGKRVQFTDNFKVYTTGWAGLQASVIWRIIDRFKMDFHFEDVSEIPWERGLKLTGLIFSLLDSWSGQLTKSMCTTCMEDLCRLAVLRCPDQPRLASSMAQFSNSVSGNVDRNFWPRQRSMTLRNDPANATPEPPELEITDGQPHPRRTLRQLIDLIEVPVHQLPLIRTLSVPALPYHLQPCSLSREAAQSTVPCDQHSSLSSGLPNAHKLSSSADARGPFFYAPFSQDPSSKFQRQSVDWVCEEPAEIELIVDNRLPVELRLSEFCVELSTVSEGFFKPSLPPQTCTSDYGSPDMDADCNAVDNGHVVQLQAVRLIVETPPSLMLRSRQYARRRSTVLSMNEPTHNSFSVQLNEGCLLETAEDWRRHSRTKPQSCWRRRPHNLSCTLPPNQSDIRLTITVVPTVEMLSGLFGAEDPVSSVVYRITGILYRLVDFGGIHVCCRPTGDHPPRLSVDSAIPLSSDLLSTTTPAKGVESQLSYCSSSAASDISALRSSFTSGIDSLPPTVNTANQTTGNSNNGPANSDFLNHPAILSVQNLFTRLPSITLKPPMPRLCIFPGLIRSAHTIQEASNVLPSCSIPCLGRSSSLVGDSITKPAEPIARPSFFIPSSDQWSKEVVASMNLMLYPYEVRWLPLQMFVRDEGYMTTFSVCNGRQSRQLNILHAEIKPQKTTADLLRQIDASTSDIVRFEGLDSIREKLPLSITNAEIESPQKNTDNTSEGIDPAEDLLPFCATECGLVWIRFDSGPFWEKLLKASSIPDENDMVNKELNVRSSRKLFFEVDLEYALDAQINTPSESPTRRNFRPPPTPLGRCARLGFQLQFLASKHGPLLLYYPQITFRDEPVRDELEEITEGAVNEFQSNPGDEFNSQSFFCCTLRGRLPQSLLPRIVRNTHSQFRLTVELSTKWRNQTNSANMRPVRITTPWTTVAEVPTSPRNRRSSFEPSSNQLGRSDSLQSIASASSESFSLIEHVDDFANEDNPVQRNPHYDLVLPLEHLSDVVLHSVPVRLHSLSELRSDEIGLPIPTSMPTLVYLIESNIEISWKSHLQIRCPKSELDAVHSDENPIESHFYRFGRFLLSGHSAESPGLDKLSSNSSDLSRSWYGHTFSGSGSVAGILWCDNLRLDVILSEFENQMLPGDTAESKHLVQGRLCGRCRRRRISKPRKSIFSRRTSQPVLVHAISNIPQYNPQAAPVEDTSRSRIKRRFSLPDLPNPCCLRVIDSDALHSALRMCTFPLQPVSVAIRGWVLNHPLRGIRWLDADATRTTDSQSSSSKICTSDSGLMVNIHRIWTGPAIYEILEKQPADNPNAEPISELRGPLIEGKEFAYVGQCAGSIGLTTRSQASRFTPQTNISSVVFLRPGRFWICGLMGVVPPSIELPSVDSPTVVNFSLPSFSNVEIVRFSPTGITVHVLERK
ncbi:unnamed protein product [Calicophoron daubneyi]|uniref:Trs120/TRAPPC9 N-terminal domain-containing protein n=1 Tax=Calicophoron daubneyi TaxID=300641 RepID=A0AAV2TLZ4_CALDB